MQLNHEAAERGIPVVDPLLSMTAIADRIQMRRVLEDLEMLTQGRVRLSPCVVVPTRVAIEEREGELAELLNHSDALLMKASVACGVGSSHVMALSVSVCSVSSISILYFCAKYRIASG